MTSDDPRLVEALTHAARDAATELFGKTGESFYYFTLTTCAEAYAPVVSAWSWDKLALVPEERLRLLKWSYADSPYYNFGAKYFDEVRELFLKLPDILEMEGAELVVEYEARMKAMELALMCLDKEGVFGEGERRNGIVINAEVMPPDYGNTIRALRLNPAAALRDWLKEAAEYED